MSTGAPSSGLSLPTPAPSSSPSLGLPVRAAPSSTLSHKAPAGNRRSEPVPSPFAGSQKYGPNGTFRAAV
jgi:hypothetical protein